MFGTNRRFVSPRPPGALLKSLGATLVENHARALFAAPIQRVWEVWNDQTAWNQEMLSVRTLTPGPLAPGSYFEALVRAFPPGTQARQVEQIVELEAPFRRTIRGIRFACVYEVGIRLERQGELTQCACWSATTLYGPLRLSAPIARKIGQKGLDSAMALVEGHLTSSAAPRHPEPPNALRSAD